VMSNRKEGTKVVNTHIFIKFVATEKLAMIDGVLWRHTVSGRGKSKATVFTLQESNLKCMIMEHDFIQGRRSI
jgi:hypothetical protein